MNKHTPGPWKVTPGFVADSTGTRVVCRWFEGKDSAMNFVNHHSSLEAGANAELIATAPDMYRELRRVEIELGGWIENERLHHEVQRDMLDRLMAVKSLLDTIRK